MNEAKKKLLRVAGILAYMFSKEEKVSTVGLTGSLARNESNPNDIDLLVLHNHGFHDFFTKHINHSHHPEKEPRYTNSGRLSMIFPTSFEKSVEHLCEIAEIKADIIVVPDLVLTDCAWLEESCNYEDITDFYKRIFCELKSLRYDPADHTFKTPELKHKDGKCCPPKISWNEVRESRLSRYSS